MFEFLENKVSVWDRVVSAKRPIMLYGMGDGAEKIMRVLDEKSVKVSEIFASDEFVRGHSWNGYKVRKFSEITAMYDEFIILVAFGVHDAPTMERIYKMSENYELYAPDVPVVGDGLFDFDFVSEHFNELKSVYNLLADEQSKKVFENTLLYKITGEVSYLKLMETEPCEVYENLLCPSGNEHYVDLGAYDGDTIREFLHYARGAGKITALEPDSRNFRKLLEKTEGVCAINAGAWSEDTEMEFSTRGGRNSRVGKGKTIEMRSLDSVLCGERADIIKFDVEGAEREALYGSRNTIKNHKPKLFCAVYHRNEDVFSLPILIKELNPDYKIYLRHYPYIPAWETNVIAI